jgi:hypothetical protein
MLMTSVSVINSAGQPASLDSPHVSTKQVDQAFEDSFRKCMDLLAEANGIHADLANDLEVVENNRDRNPRVAQSQADVAKGRANRLKGILDQLLTDECRQHLNGMQEFELERMKRDVESLLGEVAPDASNLSEIAVNLSKIIALFGGILRLIGGAFVPSPAH